jgi:S-adenosyl methyltransferase
VSSLVNALPSGSYLTITHLTADFMDADQVARARQAGQQGGITYVPRSQTEVAAFFGGLDLIEPGVVPVQAWRPDAGAPTGPHGSGFLSAVGRKP